MMINGPPPGRGSESAKTERAAIKGWGPAVRLLMLRAGETANIIAVLLVAHATHWIP